MEPWFENKNDRYRYRKEEVELDKEQLQTKKMNLKKTLTPENTEEVKPNIFLQKKGDGYRVVNPIVWNNEWRLKKQFGWRNLLWIMIILFLAWSYLHDIEAYKNFYEEVSSDPIKFCFDVDQSNIQQENEGEFNLPNNFERS